MQPMNNIFFGTGVCHGPRIDLLSDVIVARRPDERYAIFEDNARRIFPRLDKLLQARGVRTDN